MSKLNLVTGYAGKAHVSSVDHAALNTMIFGSDSFVLPFGNKMFQAHIAQQDANQAAVVIADGDMMMQGRHVRLATGDTEQVNIPMPPQHYYRDDLIVVRYTKDASGVETCSIARIEGEEDEARLGIPSYTTGDLTDVECTLHEFPLYRVKMGDGQILEIEQLFTVKNPLQDFNSAHVEVGTYGLEYFATRDSSAYVPFKTGFKNAPCVFVSQIFNDANIVVKNEDITNEGFTMRVSPVGQSGIRTVRWIAIEW